MLGQDEVIMRQFLMSKLAWTLPDGSRPLVPKDDGMGLMISAFTSRELGFGFSLDEETLKKVNQKRKSEKYSDEAAANIVFGKATKSPLTKSPFVRFLEYGLNKDRYWSYDHMIIQLEDCIDVLNVAFPDFDYIVLVDHSNGHDCLQPDGLNLNKIGVKYGGKQPKMRKTKLINPCNFGPFHTHEYKLQPGDTQNLQFSKTDLGPCYMNETERELRRYDKRLGQKRRVNKTKADLVKELKIVGVKNPKGTIAKLQEMAEARNLPLSYEEEIVIEGWVGKPKGSLQILFERGWIDP